MGCTLLFGATFQSCHDDLKITVVEEGLPATIHFKVRVPTATTVENSRSADDAESQIKDLYMVMRSATSPRVKVINLFEYLSNETDASTNVLENAGKDTNGYRQYSLDMTYQANDLSGTYSIYIIANPSSNFSNLVLQDGSLDGTDFENLLVECTLYNKKLDDSKGLPMSCKLGDNIQVIQNTTTTIDNDIVLERLVARIEFYIKTGTGVTFKPTSYQVFNLPQKAKLINAGSSSANMLDEEDGVYFDDQAVNALNSQTEFSFLMLENVQNDVDIPSTITLEDGTVKSVDPRTLRQEWTYTTTGNTTGESVTVTPAEKKKLFKYAPSTATFVVVTGSYSGPGPIANGTATTYTGTVSYTIHLGDFSANSVTSDTETNAGNFTVNRNELHKYRITVNGVNSIVNEASNTVLGETNQAAEVTTQRF